MSDLKERMRALDLVEPPELRRRVGTQEAPTKDRPPVRLLRALAALLAALAMAGVVYVAIQNTTNEPIRPSPKPNGPIYFLGTPESGPGPSSLYAIDPDGTGIRQIPISGYPSSLAVSPNGRLIAFSTGDGGEFSPRNIHVMQVDGSHPRRITSMPEWNVRLPTLQESDPDWAHDGRRLVFESNRDCCEAGQNRGPALYVVTIDGSALRQLETGANAMHPAWSPAGSTIAYVRPSTDGGQEIMTINVEESRARVLTSNGRINIDLAWSPDGREIAYASFVESDSSLRVIQEDWQIRVIDADGSNERTIYRCKETCRFGGYSLDWSPDGKEIVFNFTQFSNHDLEPRLGVIGVDGSGLRVFDPNGIRVYAVSWAAGG